MTTNIYAPYCGAESESEEVGFCRKHAAEYLNVPMHIIVRRIETGRYGTLAAELNCSVRRRGDKQFIPLGELLND